MKVKAVFACSFTRLPQKRISATFREVPLQVGLKMLVRNYNHSFVYRSSGSDIGQVVCALFILSQSGDTKRFLSNAGRPIKAPVLAMEETPEAMAPPGAMNSYNTIPIDNDPLISMNAIDPLVRFGKERPLFLPPPLP